MTELLVAQHTYQALAAHCRALEEDGSPAYSARLARLRAFRAFSRISLDLLGDHLEEIGDAPWFHVKHCP